MKTRILAMFGFWIAPALPGNSAVISYVEALRYFQLGSVTVSTSELDQTYYQEHGGTNSFASQRTRFEPTTISVTSAGRGGGEIGMSVCYVSFNLAGATDFQLSGQMALLGNGGFACVSLTDLLHPQEPLVFEVLAGTPGNGAPTIFSSGGALKPGSYRIETIVYSGDAVGGGSGELQALFVVPEASVAAQVLLGLLGGALWRHRSARSSP